MFDTIVALATAPVKSALAIIRVSGDDSFAVVSKLFSRDLTHIAKRQIVYGKIRDGKESIDEVIVLVYVGPKSFTGENLVEIICHGSVLIANQIIELLIKQGARLAVRGEFSNRAYLHSRIDLIQAEAINDMINSTSAEAKKLSLMSLEGKTSSLILPLKEHIADLVSLIEVNIDYPEYEDIEKVNKEKIIKETTALHSEIQKLIAQGRQGKIIKEGLNVAIVGKPNVGKSSLLNALIKEDKAIVTSIAGTTRDVVEGDVNLKGITLHLYDTAGIRPSTDLIESIGIDKAKKTLADADLVLLVLDASRKLDQDDQEMLSLTEGKKRIIVYNKSDIVTKKEDKKLYISALNHDISRLEEAIAKLFGIEEESYLRPSLNNARQLGLLEQADEALQNAKKDAFAGLSIDLVSVSLLEAYHAVLNLLGEENQNDLSDEIFSRFCVGK
ncbi:MAG: tRNA uridine-5-carboxymethylaminomethyl(34) synthesis GTPase MnmE [Firmicutes bacterium]|nr:tRNA uridine-5-carboxymethylaminomethyl(34) synthesis GTPase MnmE [Bacillota bacterium]